MITKKYLNILYISALSFLLWAFQTNAAPVKKPQPINQTLPLNELRAFSEVYYYVKSTYVEEVDDRQLLNAAIKGMVTSLDGHSRYMDSSDFSDFSADNNGEYAGIGLSFNDHSKGIEINSVVKNSPAHRQNLKQGMIVTKINGINIKDITADDAYKLLHGKINSSVTLSIIDPTEVNQKVASVKDYQLVREIVMLPSVDSQRLPNNTGYLAINQFTKKSPQEFIEAISIMSEKQPIKNLIIDLRNNPGGVLESAIEISDFFVEDGTLLTSTGRIDDANEVFHATSLAPYSDLQVVVVMNQNSASSSEILAAALQDHDKATILGDVSYGKGSIQSIIFLERESGLKITTANYFTPKGKKIQDVGVKPDVMFKTANLENNEKSEILDDLELLQAFKLISKK